MKFFLKTLLVVFLLVFICETCRAESQKSKCPYSIEVFSGFGTAKLHEKGSYHLAPLFVDFDFDLKPLTRKIGINPPVLFQFTLEPFAAYVYEPDDNLEAGANMILRVGLLPDTFKFQPYITGGGGGVYMTTHTKEQATQLNFNEHFGAGMRYFFKENSAFTFEYRFRHTSNGGVTHPNHGINTNLFLFGICFIL